MILRNYYSMQPYSLLSSVGGYIRPDGTSGTVTSGTPNIKSLMQTRRASYTDGAGVVFGTGDAAPTISDTRLSGSIVSGYTSSYSQTSGVDKEGRPYVTTLYTLTNTGDAAKTIKEVGILATVASSACALIERTVLETPVTLEASSGVAQIEYTVSYDAPLGEMADAFNACGGDDVYGVQWDMSSSSALMRIGASALFSDPTPATSLTENGSSPFDAIKPWSGMVKETVDGTDEMVFIPEFYYCVGRDRYSRRFRWAISPTAKTGFAKHPGSGRYVGRYHTSGSSAAVYSKSGVVPLVSTSRTNFRAYSHNKGDNWWMIDIATWSAIQLLYLVEFAHWDSQATLGTGNVGGSAVSAVGGTDGAIYHTLKRDGASNQYRWIEDLWSNGYDWLDGFVARDRACYVGTDNSNFADVVDGLTATGVTLPSGGYITNFGYSDQFPWLFLPESAANSNAGYIPDYVYSNTGTMALSVGGGYTSNDYRGLWYFDAGISASGTSANIGSRLLYIP